MGRAAEKLEDAVVEMTTVATVVEATSQPMPRRDPLRKYMDIIYREVAFANTHSISSIIFLIDAVYNQNFLEHV